MFKILYNILASKDRNHLIIDIKTMLEDIGRINIGRILKMEYVRENEFRLMLIEPDKWNLSIRNDSHRHLRLIKYVKGVSLTYDFEFPDQNEDILKEFLILIKNRCKEQGIIV